MISTSQKIFTVSEIVQEARANLEAMYPAVWVEGEISNANAHSSGHFYFSLKDSAAQLNVVLFRDDFRRLRFRPESGLHVIVGGRLTLYPAQGKFQMVASMMEPKGKGALQLAFEQLKAKLEKEGLFHPDRKKPIPALPQWIGIVTSPDGAALHDMLSVLNRRFANVRILIIPVRVQGMGAAEEISQALAHLNREFAALDVILVGRGGGSLEDLWAFNEEIVARAIAGSRIPIISCVGHETDFTIADFVADLRAPTPSAAAELVIRAKTDILQQLDDLSSRLQSSMAHRFESLEQRLSHAFSSRVLADPWCWLNGRVQDYENLRGRLAQAARFQSAQWEQNLRHLLEKLHILSPLAILSRGYAIAWRLRDHLLLKEAAQTDVGDSIEVQLHKGRVYAKVERTDI